MSASVASAHGTYVSNLKMHVPENGHASLLELCHSHFVIKEKLSRTTERTQCSKPLLCTAVQDSYTNDVAVMLFHATKDDNQPSFDVEDRELFYNMANESYENESGTWVAPPPLPLSEAATFQ